MNFIEWWGESIDPGGQGHVAVGEEHEPCPYLWLVWLRFVFVVLALPALWIVAVTHVPLPLWQSVAVVLGGTLIYVAVSYLFDPQPDAENLGWAGGMVDNPMRISDDWNRGLLLVKILLGPGRFVAESLIDIRQAFRNRWSEAELEESLQAAAEGHSHLQYPEA
ncbi:MAG: hypothetical protein ACOY3P_03315 [Planctomycetota bacterium]